jgi:hypothetical protein
MPPCTDDAATLPPFTRVARARAPKRRRRRRAGTRRARPTTAHTTLTLPKLKPNQTPPFYPAVLTRTNQTREATTSRLPQPELPVSCLPGRGFANLPSTPLSPQQVQPDASPSPSSENTGKWRSSA